MGDKGLKVAWVEDCAQLQLVEPWTVAAAEPVGVWGARPPFHLRVWRVTLSHCYTAFQRLGW